MFICLKSTCHYVLPTLQRYGKILIPAIPFLCYLHTTMMVYSYLQTSIVDYFSYFWEKIEYIFLLTGSYLEKNIYICSVLPKLADGENHLSLCHQ